MFQELLLNLLNMMFLYVSNGKSTTAWDSNMGRLFGGSGMGMGNPLVSSNMAGQSPNEMGDFPAMFDYWMVIVV